MYTDVKCSARNNGMVAGVLKAIFAAKGVVKRQMKRQQVSFASDD